MGKTIEYYKTISDLWQFTKKYLPVCTDDEYWSQLTSETRTFAEEHGNTKFAQDLILAVVNELDREAIKADGERIGHS